MTESPHSGPPRSLPGRLEKGVGAAALCVSGVSFVGMLLIVLFSIALRFLEIPFFWGEEAARYLMFTGIYIGMSVAVREKAHLGVDLFVRLFPPGAGRVLRLICGVVTILVYAGLTKVSWDFTARMARGKQISPALSIPMYILYGIIFAGFALCCLESLFILRREWREPAESAGGGGEEQGEEVRLA